MYRRLNAFLAVLIVVVFTMLVIPALTFGDEIGFGPLYTKGHSYDGGYSVESGVGGSFSYEMPWKKKHVNIGLSYSYLKFEAQDNVGCSSDTIDANLFAAYLKPYWQVSKNIRWAFMAGLGADISEDHQGPMMVTGTALEYWVSPHWAVAPTFNLYISEERNYKAGAFIIKYAF